MREAAFWALGIVLAIFFGGLGVFVLRSLAPPPDPRDTRGSDELDEAWKALSPKARAWIIHERENKRSTKND